MVGPAGEGRVSWTLKVVPPYLSRFPVYRAGFVDAFAARAVSSTNPGRALTLSEPA